MFAFKVLILAASSVALCQCAYLAAGPALVSTGQSVSTRQQDSTGRYNFAYDIVDHLGARNGRSESGDAYGNKIGHYNLADIDGRVRRVDYVADDFGFRAAIQTNEPGTVPSNTAAASYNPPLLAAPIAVAAPLAVAAPAPAIIDSMAKLLAPGVPAYGASPLYGFARKA